MKKILILPLSFLMPISSMATCYKSNEVFMSILKKEDNQNYVVSYDSGSGMTTGFLKTKTVSFSSTGQIAFIGVEKVGTTKARLANGFEKTVTQWEECSADSDINEKLYKLTPNWAQFDQAPKAEPVKQEKPSRFKEYNSCTKTCYDKFATYSKDDANKCYDACEKSRP